MNWILKARTQNFFSSLPAGDCFYGLAQRWFGGLRDLRIEKKAEQIAPLIEKFYETGNRFENKKCLEIGTGWVPAVPLLFWLLGQKTCVTIDTVRLLDHYLVKNAATQLVRLARESEDAPFFPPGAGDFMERTKCLEALVNSQESGADILRACNIDYRAPRKLAQAGIDDETMDLIYSTSTFEHVSAEELPELIAESFRILKPGGFALHVIDAGDHFAHADRSISPVNFLRYSREEFEKYNNRFCFQNRLRAPEYRNFFLKAGFEMIHWNAIVNEPALLSLRGFKPDKEFQKFSVEENAALTIHVIARKP